MAQTAAGDHSDDCRSCPVCVLRAIVRGVRPEVRTHLAAAGRELLLALDAALAATDSAAAEQVWADEQRGRSPDMPLPADTQPRSTSPTPLRRISVE